MKLSSMAVDTNLERSGVWVSCNADGTAEFLIASAANAAYRAKAFPIGNRGLEIEDDEKAARERMMTPQAKRAAAEELLIDWRGIEDDEGNQIRYTPELGFEKFSDPAYRHIYEFVIFHANKASHFKRKEIESAGKP